MENRIVLCKKCSDMVEHTVISKDIWIISKLRTIYNVLLKCSICGTLKIIREEEKNENYQVFD